MKLNSCVIKPPAYWLTLLALVLVSGLVSAVFCDQEPITGCQCREITAVDYDGNPLYWDIIPDIQEGSDWFNSYCDETSLMKQKRTVLEIVKPSCNQRIETTEYRSIDPGIALNNPSLSDVCQHVPAPKTISTWQPTQCAGTKTIYKRVILAYYFTEEKGKLKEQIGRFEEHEYKTNDICSNKLGQTYLGTTNWLQYNWTMVLATIIAIVVLTIAVYIYIKKS